MSKEITMSIKQFMEVQRGEKTYKDIETENGLESLAGRILNDNRLRRLTVFTIAALNYSNKVLASTVDAENKINQGGLMLLGLAQTLGYWLCIISCIMEVLKCVMNGSSKDVGKIILKYLLIFGTLYLMPWLFDLIKQIFETSPETVAEVVTYVR